MALIRKTIIAPEIDLQVIPCGEANAFSSPSITLCTELVSEMVTSYDAYGIDAVFYYELAHSLLRVWDDNRYKDEVVADELGVVLSSLLNEKHYMSQRSIVKFLSRFDTGNEFMSKAYFGDRHPYSIDRIQKIGLLAASQPHFSLIRDQWMVYLIPRLTAGYLRAIVSTANEESVEDDTSLRARAELRRREQR